MKFWSQFRPHRPTDQHPDQRREYDAFHGQFLPAPTIASVTPPISLFDRRLLTGRNLLFVYVINIFGLADRNVHDQIDEVE